MLSLFLTMTNNNTKYEIGDLLISYPLKKHLGVVISLFEKAHPWDKSKRLAYTRVYCDTLNPNVTFYDIPTSYGIHNKESLPAWIKVA
jgi:hypothetical protein